MKILLGDFNAKVGRENIFKPTIGNESLHQYSNGACGTYGGGERGAQGSGGET